jgi:cytochrome c biogenesis protein CcmG/thiol:disulfide interchange protein DsbE
MNRRLLLLAPFGLAVAGGASFWTVLQRMKTGEFDPRGLPSQMIGKPVPEFALDGFTRADILAQKAPVVLNFFASWCVPCIDEAPMLVALKQAGVPIWGIAYKDKQPQTEAFLAKNGNPYRRIARDLAGQVGIEWGITGVPETYIIDASGIVRWRYAGPLSAQAASVVTQMATA